ncbi:cytochrome P450 [Jaminaea rosea]|uniref:Cytochrome P450 n=1 Tax=Jaminaea rosea TaxID=1569628 RepID=A0A316URX1_9BASI|nr:cytochrome P450 [Jaminaea rosea]PWN27518.1 cytochrome P450 [Jaminaea rosea]
MLVHPYTLVAAGALLLASICYLLFVPPAKLHSNFNSVPVIKSRFPGLGAVGFFANRYTFLSRSTTTDPRHPHHGIYKFSLLGKVVYHVGSTSESVMRSITTNKDLSFSGGNNFLFAGIAGAGQKGGDAQGKIDAEERKEMMAIAKAISPQRLALMRSALTHDALEAYEGWLNGGESALVDLQKGYYPLIFRFTVRLMGMAEYASQPATLAKLQTGFWQTQRNSGYWTTLLPWIPQPRLLTRLCGALTLWKMVRTDVRKRIKEGRKEEDFAQNLIDARDMGVDKIARWVIGALLAGILNTIGTGAYTIAFLGASPELRAACREEVERTLRASAEARGDEYEELSLHERLARVELSEWEEGFELLHLCFKEAIRLLLTNSLNRYYPGPSKGSPRLVIDGHPIEDDVYVTFSPPSNLHDADSFSNPFHFDPYRYQRGEGSTDYSYIAWGAGRHKCTGMRFAKLETIVALATLLAYSDDFTTVDERGEAYGLDNVPLPDLSQSHWREPTRYMRVRVERKKGGEKKGRVF